MLPVLMSINCSSAAFDYDETSFVAEALVKPNGGAVGAFGDTRDSPSTANTQISLGFADALLPFILPSEGPAIRQRVGDALIHGKMRLNGISPLPNGTTRSEFYLWHYFGDPTMQMWGAKDPSVVDHQPASPPSSRRQIEPPPPDPPPYWVQVTLPPEFNGQAFSLLRQGVVIGKGVAAGGSVNIPAGLARQLGTLRTAAGRARGRRLPAGADRREGRGSASANDASAAIARAAARHERADADDGHALRGARRARR